MPKEVKAKKGNTLASFRVNRQEFLARLECVRAGLSKRPIVEQSCCVVFQDGLMITYNDEVACQASSGFPDDFSGAVQAEPLADILSKLIEEEVDISAEGTRFVVTGKNRRARIRMEAEVLLPYDNVEQPDDDAWRPLHADFAEAINLVQSCAGKDESEFSLTCIHIHPKWVEASDRNQIARYRLKTSMEQSVLLRRDSVKHIIALGMTDVAETDSWCHFRNSTTGLVLSCRRFIEEYKDMTDLLDVSGCPIQLPKGLVEAAEKASVFSGENQDNNLIEVRLKAGRVAIKGEGSQGDYTEQKRLRYDGQDLRFMISPELLTELVKRHSECEIAIDRLKVSSGRFVYLCALGKVEGHSSNGKAAKENEE